MAPNPASIQLAAVPLFDNLTTKELGKLQSLSTTITFPAGRILVEQGAYGHEVFVLLSGSVNVSRNQTDIVTLGEGTVIGEMAIIDRLPRSATVVSATEITALVFTSQEFASALDTLPGLSRRIMQSLAARLRSADEQLAENHTAA
jgi:CRP/FNR family transcriptional regulator, cyclic AMP receptor protein